MTPIQYAIAAAGYETGPDGRLVPRSANDLQILNLARRSQLSSRRRKEGADLNQSASTRPVLPLPRNSAERAARGMALKEFHRRREHSMNLIALEPQRKVFQRSDEDTRMAFVEGQREQELLTAAVHWLQLERS